MTKNLFYCLAGIALGFSIGFFLANKMSSPPRTLEATTIQSSSTAAREAPPLDPTQTDGTLPPGHPKIDNAEGATNSTANPNGVAATSAQAQAAMEAADRQPKDFDLQMNAAAIFYQAGALDKASLYLQRALEVKPKDADALTALGNTKYDLGDFAGAVTYYERVMTVQPKNADVQTDLGNSYFRRTPPDYTRAIAEYRKALTIDPKHEKALQNTAAAALQLGDKATARDAVERLNAVNPSNPTLSSLRSSLDAAP